VPPTKKENFRHRSRSRCQGKTLPFVMAFNKKEGKGQGNKMEMEKITALTD
jgi:hypothetical protein